MTTPSLSILTPSFNYARFLSDAMNSVFAQGLGDEVELVIQDADSWDGTAEIVQENSAADRRVLFIQEPDLGQSDALNRALRRASGALIGWLNADEFYLPGAFAAVTAAVAAHPTADQDGRLLRIVPAHVFSEFVLRHYGCFISSCATFIRRDALGESPWDLSLNRSMDWDLWLSLTRQSNVVYIPRVLAAFRVHAGQVTNLPEAMDAEEFHRLFAKHGIAPRALKKSLATLAHAGLKIRARGYARQRRALAGTPVDVLGSWPSDVRARDAADFLVEV
jgi:glycosyltransferase involved in cell wall biosynthesis